MKFTFSPESRPLDGYTIKRAIHRGGFGEVYYAISDAGREVALKLLQHNTEVELRGVQQCLNLTHPNLVTIFDVRSDAEGDHWIIMEYVSGETLDEAIRRHPQGMPPALAWQWIRGIVDATQYLHSRGIVHRDLKPANVFSQENLIKVGDVGLSKFITASRRSAQTQSVGTVYYMAPEVAKGKYGLEVDIYALGIMAYEMVTGAVPFDGESTGEILLKHLTELPNLNRLPEPLRPVIGKALQKSPQDRFRAAAEFGTALEAALFPQLRGTAQAGGQAANLRDAQRPIEPLLAADSVPRELPDWVTVQATQPQSRGADAVGICAGSFLNRFHWAEVAGFVAVGLFVMSLEIWRIRSGVSWLQFSPVDLLLLGLLLTFGWVVARRRSGFSWWYSNSPVKTLLGAEADQARRAHWMRVGNQLAAAALVLPVTVALTAATVLIAPRSSMEQISGSSSPDLAVPAFIAGGAALLSWGILAVPLAFRMAGRRAEEIQRWTFVLPGVLTGCGLWLLSEYLLVHFANVPTHGFKQFDDHQLVTVLNAPTFLGFITFSTLLMTMRRWQWLTIPTRSKRTDIPAAILTGAMIWGLTYVLAFPHFLAALWGVMVGITVQLCSPWYERPAPGRVAR